MFCVIFLSIIMACLSVGVSRLKQTQNISYEKDDCRDENACIIPHYCLSTIYRVNLPVNFSVYIYKGHKVLTYTKTLIKILKTQKVKQ